MQIKILNMVAEHIPFVIELEQRCQLNSRGADSYRNLLQKPLSILLVSLDENLNVVGCFSGWIVVDELEIDNVAVAPGFRKMGIGSKLLEEALEMARKKGAHQAFLEVRSSNNAARSLYEKNGFSLVGKRKNYYRNPVEDALILSREITKAG